MTSKLIIQELATPDKAAVRQLLLDGYKQYENEFTDKEAWHDYVENIKHSIDNPNIDRILVAKQAEKVVGTLQLFKNADVAYGRPELDIHSPIVRLLAVHPEARGQGVAQALLRESLLYAYHQGAAHLYLHSGDIMKKAIQLYEWIGFKRDVAKEFFNRDVHVKCFRYDLTERNDWLESDIAREAPHRNTPPPAPVSGIVPGGI
ncbi:GNAT family N-acetyltransferase [Domibacillus tundrae]|uniref:GNAT family N-acetyltransferase n=1 Tax=Domibacillus tundrae TaxID=1587527 RepID=UPI0033971F7E